MDPGFGGLASVAMGLPGSGLVPRLDVEPLPAPGLLQNTVREG